MQCQQHPSLSLTLFRLLLPASPIEDPETWAWGLHPDNGLDYKARDSLSVEVCLANPELIDTAKCSLPRDLCLSNAKFTPLVGCSGHLALVSLCQQPCPHNQGQLRRSGQSGECLNQSKFIF